MASLDTPLTLVHGATFAISDRSGQISPDGYHGVYHRDIRVISTLHLTIDGKPPAVLTSHREGAGQGDWVYVLAEDAHSSPTAVLTRRRIVGAEVREYLEVHVYSGRIEGATVTVDISADFANLLELKGRDRMPPAPVRFHQVNGALRASDGPLRVDVRAAGDGVRMSESGIRWRLDLTPGESRRLDLEIVPQMISAEPPGANHTVEPGAPAEAASTLRISGSSARWTRSTASALEDLRGLRIDVPAMGLRYLGAGAPWFMALFGRDTLLTAWQSLIGGPSLAMDVLTALASRQGQREDPRTGEQPGKILHEMRTGLAPVFGVDPGTPYFGTVDASPLFVMLLAEAHRWGAEDGAVRALLPAARAAVEWCIRYGDIDGDGFVEYVGDERGLANQGWKDSGDSMVHSDGSLAEGPIALAEVQGYVFAAYHALAQLEERLGEPAAATELRERAGNLRKAFAERFWLPDQELVAMALDGDKQPLAVSSSNIGHCLWTGLLDGGVADTAAERLTRSDLAAAWGIRTLGASEAAYNPLGYHLGSIWPHDSAIGIAGLIRHGHVEPARKLVDGLLTAAEAFDWRLPELLGGMDTDEIAHPVPYPVACSPQAWSAAVPLLLLRSMLRLEPDVPAGEVRVAPVLGADEEIVVSGIPLGGGTLSLRVRGEAFEVLEAPEHLRVH